MEFTKLARPKAERIGLSANVLTERRAELDAILQHHQSKGAIDMSRTQVIEQLIHKEFKRLKLNV